jgi:hypothetical protein
VGTSGAGAFASRGRARDSAWEQGASVERIVGAWLDRIPGIEVLHDRRLVARRSRMKGETQTVGAFGANPTRHAPDRAPRVGATLRIDHLAISPGGVFVVDAKLSGWRLGPVELRHSTRPRPAERSERAEEEHEKLLARIATQARAVARLLADAPVPVAPALCLVDARGAEVLRSVVLDGVWVGTPPALPELLGHAGLLDGEAMRTVAARLDARLA